MHLGMILLMIKRRYLYEVGKMHKRTQTKMWLISDMPQSSKCVYLDWV